MSTQNFDRTYFADAQFDRSGSTALQQGVRAILFAAATTTAGVAGAQVVEGQQVEGQQIEEIVVTAARREQSFQDVPMAVSALNAQRLRDTGIDGSNQGVGLDIRPSPGFRAETAWDIASDNGRFKRKKVSDDAHGVGYEILRQAVRRADDLLEALEEGIPGVRVREERRFPAGGYVRSRLKVFHMVEDDAFKPGFHGKGSFPGSE